MIEHGAKTLVVPGMIPSGCAPPILVTFEDADASEYDATTGCLKEPNEIVKLHNSLLRDAIQKLRAEHPDVTIIHTDLFNHVMEMVKSPEKFGQCQFLSMFFNVGSALRFISLRVLSKHIAHLFEFIVRHES